MHLQKKVSSSSSLKLYSLQRQMNSECNWAGVFSTSWTTGAEGRFNTRGVEALTLAFWTLGAIASKRSWTVACKWLKMFYKMLKRLQMLQSYGKKFQTELITLLNLITYLKNLKHKWNCCSNDWSKHCSICFRAEKQVKLDCRNEIKSTKYAHLNKRKQLQAKTSEHVQYN